MRTVSEPRPLGTVARRAIALAWGLTTHALFLVGVGAMIVNLHQGMRWSLAPLAGRWGYLVDTLLILQFPLLHSFLLGRRGRALLARLAPGELGEDLVTTTFAAIAAIQVGATFLLWSPSGIVWFEPHGAAAVGMDVLYAASWIFLGKALWDAGLPLQTGSLGWWSVLRGRHPRLLGFPTRGLFRFIRQPVYLGFALTLWTGPVRTPDRLVLALAWTAYCALGPRLKERRYLAWHGEAYRRYQSEVPYMAPRRRRAA